MSEKALYKFISWVTFVLSIVALIEWAWNNDPNKSWGWTAIILILANICCSD